MSLSPGIGLTLTVSLPITIGTIPLQAYIHQFTGFGDKFGSGVELVPSPAIYNPDTSGYPTRIYRAGGFTQKGYQYQPG